jgi:predicted transcriptional regulator
MGELEAEVMAILWDGGTWMTPREVLVRLSGGPPIVYSTVMTIMRRLWKKGVLERRALGKGFTYLPRRGKEEQTAASMVALLSATNDAETALTHFLAGIDESKRRQLRRLLAKSRK